MARLNRPHSLTTTIVCWLFAGAILQLIARADENLVGQADFVLDESAEENVHDDAPRDRDQEEPMSEEEARAVNKSRAVLLTVVSLSWPSEGALGIKVAHQYPASGVKHFSWSKAEKKAMGLLKAINAEMQGAPSEEILLALGYRYFYGIGTDKDCVNALSMYKAVGDSVVRHMEENDGRESKLDLGLMRISLSEVDGILGEEYDDIEEELEWDVLNAKGGDTWAQKEVGWRTLVGQGLEENHEEAFQHLQQAAAANDPGAQHNLGYVYMYGLGTKRNFSEARRYFEQAAEANLTAALNALGYMHYKGVGIKRNLTLGEHFLKRGADQGDADAAFNLAVLYQELDGNMTRALPFIQQGADAGFWKALMALSEVEQRGLRAYGEPGMPNCTAAVLHLKTLVETFGGVANELREGVLRYKKGEYVAARDLFCELAEQGVEVAQSNCAWLTMNGRGLQPVPDAPAGYTVDQALRLRAVSRMFHRSGQQGGADSHLRLGDMALHGKGTEPNVTAAFAHYLIAASRRSLEASFKVGVAYHLGLGVEPNLTLARRYYMRSGTREHFSRYPAHIALACLAIQIYTEELAAWAGIEGVKGVWAVLAALGTLAAGLLTVLILALCGLPGADGGGARRAQGGIRSAGVGSAGGGGSRGDAAAAAAVAQAVDGPAQAGVERGGAGMLRRWLEWGAE